MSEQDEDSRFWALAAHMPEHPAGKWGLVDEEEGGIVAWFDTAAEAWFKARRGNGEVITVEDVAALVDPAAAQLAVARAMAAFGAELEWDSETIEYVADAVRPAFPKDLPSVFDQDDAAVEFWESLV